jgi:hypothetical protein
MPSHPTRKKYRANSRGGIETNRFSLPRDPFVEGVNLAENPNRALRSAAHLNHRKRTLQSLRTVRPNVQRDS